MTTNQPKTLDSALIRPGRVDLQVKFTLATRDQIRDMYKRMYNDKSKARNSETKPPEMAQIDMHKSIAGWDDLGFDLRPYIASAIRVQPEKLGEMAEMFADKLAEETFSPAEIQGFLLERKKDPEAALREVEKWRDEQIKSRTKVNEEEEGAVLS